MTDFPQKTRNHYCCHHTRHMSAFTNKNPNFAGWKNRTSDKNAEIFRRPTQNSRKSSRLKRKQWTLWWLLLFQFCLLLLVFQLVNTYCVDRGHIRDLNCFPKIVAKILRISYRKALILNNFRGNRSNTSIRSGASKEFLEITTVAK